MTYIGEHEAEDIEIIIAKHETELDSLKPITSLDNMYREHDLEVVIDALKLLLHEVKERNEDKYGYNKPGYINSIERGTA